ncbi:OmpA family protein [Methylocystis iwaonis]|uniref:OmpA family protein n=1 Tax=Methylocystis iwaonis TaxID=2885079 RepID=UPI002E7B27E6|nr:OmpA family protein [Methylocystis iwaonis]
MLDFYVPLWPWLAACFGVGAAMGALAPGKTRGKKPARWLIWLGLASIAGAAAIALGAVQGAISHHLEAALACFVSFMIGAGAAALIFQRTLAGHEAWALGLIPAALLWWGASEFTEPAYEAELQKRVAALAQTAGVDPSGMAPREVTAPPAVAANKEPNVVAPVPEASPTLVNAPAPASQPPAELDRAACQRALDAVQVSDPVAFREARATVNRRTALALDKAAEVIRQCPEATIEVRGHGDGGAEDDLLSRRRALAAVHYLRLEGVSGHKLVAIGCCEKAGEGRRPVAIEYIVR